MLEQWPQCGSGSNVSGRQPVVCSRAKVGRPALLSHPHTYTHTHTLPPPLPSPFLQAVVQQALNRLMAGRTVLVIAHRLSTIRDAHRICVINGGQLAEQGSHEELLAAKGMYAGLIARQLAGSADGGSSSSRSGSSCDVGGAGCGDGGSIEGGQLSLGSMSDLSEGVRGGSLQPSPGRGGAGGVGSSGSSSRGSIGSVGDSIGSNGSRRNSTSAEGREG